MVFNRNLQRPESPKKIQLINIKSSFTRNQAKFTQKEKNDFQNMWAVGAHMVRIQKNLSWFPKAAVLYSVEKCSDNLVVPILHQAFKHDYDQEKYLILRPGKLRNI